MKRSVLLFWLLISFKVISAQEPDFFCDDNTGCAPLIASFETEGLANASFLSWDFGNGTILGGDPSLNPTLLNPTIPYIDDGIYDVVLDYTLNGENGSIERPSYIECYSIPFIDFSSDKLLGCGSFEVNFESEVSVPFGEIQSYLWDFGNGEISTEVDPQTIYNTPGQFDVSLSIVTEEGCEATYTDESYILVEEGPVVSFELNTNFACEIPFEVEITNTSDAPNDAEYVWDFGDGQSSDQDVDSHIYTDWGEYTITLIGLDSSTCNGEYEESILIHAMETQFIATEGCAPTWISFQNESSLGFDHYVWDFGDPDSGNDNTDSSFHSIHYYEEAGSYTVSLSAANSIGCADSISQEITLEEVGFEYYLEQDLICAIPSYVDFSVTTPGITEIQWTLIDSVMNPVISGTSLDHTFFFGENFFTYEQEFYHLELILEYEGGCEKTLFIEDFLSICVPDINFIASPKSGCIPLEVGFSDFSTYPLGIEEIEWDTDDGSILSGNSTSYTYTEFGTYFPSLQITTTPGCVIEKSLGQIRAGENIVPDFTYIPDTLCHMETFTVVYTGPWVDELKWAYPENLVLTDGDIDTLQLVANSICSGIGLKLYSDNNGCIDSTYQSLDSVIFKGPQAKLKAPTFLGCVEDSPYQVLVENNTCSTTPEDSIIYSWTFSSADSIIQTTDSVFQIDSLWYSQQGNHLVTLETSSSLNECVSQTSVEFLVDKLSLQFLYRDTVYCHPPPIRQYGLSLF